MLDEIGDVRGKTRISKRGNRALSEQWCEATLSDARHNLHIRAIYHRLKKGDKPGTVAGIAAARELLLIATDKDLRSNSQATQGCLSCR